mgnify:FL=1|jgi:hypothetical protein
MPGRPIATEGSELTKKIFDPIHMEKMNGWRKYAVTKDVDL